MSKSRNQLLNIVEAIAAFLVVFIHFPLPGMIGNIVTAIARFAVPFFFSISGYFFYKGNQYDERNTIPRKIKRLVRLLLFSEAVYFLFYAALQVQNIGFTFRAFSNVIVSEVFQRYLGQWYCYIPVLAPPINGFCWFIGSLIAIYAVIYVTKGRKMSLTVSVLLLAFGILLRCILCSAGVKTLFPYERLLPLLPFPFFMIGYYLRKYKDFCDGIDYRIYSAMLLIGAGLTVAESFAGAYTLYFGTPWLVVAAIALCGKYSRHEVGTWIGQLFNHIGEKTATYIYIFHMMVGNVLYVLVTRILAVDDAHWITQWGIPSMVCVSTAIVAEIGAVLKQALLLKRR